MKNYIHELFNPKIESASDVIKNTTEGMRCKLEEVIHINDYEAVCIFSFEDYEEVPQMKGTREALNKLIIRKI